MILINIERKKGPSPARRFAKNRGLSEKVIHLEGSPPEGYGIKYIPHPCSMDGTGKVLTNYAGGLSKAIEAAAKAAGQEVPKCAKDPGCTLI
mmetsp:Transcript_27907/g.67828  ORF Transcript_27907/g.67828 Transcript_27907/m.67828 type:complete len:92 (+) Transcript_27907:255-530(+)